MNLEGAAVQIRKLRFIGILILSLTWVLMASLPAGAVPQTLEGVTLLQVAPRILSPNNDSRNDRIFFIFDNPLSGLPVESAIFDINGAKVADMGLNSNETALTWDGKDTSGQPVQSGIYVYSIKIGKSLATGTVVVAK